MVQEFAGPKQIGAQSGWGARTLEQELPPPYKLKGLVYHTPHTLYMHHHIDRVNVENIENKARSRSPINKKGVAYRIPISGL